jgi:hypothetical protein
MGWYIVKYEDKLNQDVPKAIKMPEKSVHRHSIDSSYFQQDDVSYHLHVF